MLTLRFFILYFFLSVSLYGQKEQIESLKLKLPQLKDDSSKVIALKDISFYYHFINPDSGINYANKAILLAKDIKWPKGIASSYNSLGVNFNAKTEFGKALDAHQYALKIRKELGDAKAIAASLGNIGLIFESLADYPSALEYQQMGLKIFETQKNFYFLALSYINIGNIYDKIGDVNTALNYQLKALKISQKIKVEELQILSYSNLGNAYLKLNKYDSAFKYQTKGIELSIKYGNEKATLNGYGNLGLIAEKNENINQAIIFQEKCFELAKKISDDYAIGLAKNNLARLFLKKNLFDKSVLEAEYALNKSSKINAVDISKESHFILSQVYEKKMNIDKSYFHFKKFIKLRDSIFSEENSKLLTTKALKYEFEKEIDKRKLEEEKQKSLNVLELKKQKQIRYIFASALLISLFLLFFVYKNYKQKTKINIELNDKNKTIEHQKKEITDSINYAKRIQNAILPDTEIIKNYLDDSFILYEPKDIVSGDFYNFKVDSNGLLIACADCTGHGVPGAFMSLIGMKELQIACENESEPSEILRALNVGIKKTLKQNEIDGTRDGMDIAICKIYKNKLTYSGANRSLWVLKQSEDLIEEIKATKMAIGGYTLNDQLFVSHSIECNKGDIVYMTSDGFADQFGGPQNKKLTTKKFKDLLLSIKNQPMNNQHDILKKFIVEWRGNNEQLDDILVIGFKLV
jgi:serine phosphatase RsbU (regulator of sigma subunit)